jgi:hypothetical protein
MKRPNKLVLLAVAFLFIGLRAERSGAQGNVERPFGKVRLMAERSEATQTVADNRALGVEVARYSIALHFASNGNRPSEESVVALGDALGALQQAWRAGNDKGIAESRLTKSLNDLMLSPDDKRKDHLKFHERELRAIRLRIWMQAPELSTGRDRHDRGQKATGPLFERTMSPIEAFLAADWLVYAKITEDDFVRTDDEYNNSPRKSFDDPKPGVHMKPANPRRLEFEARVQRVARERFSSTDAIVDTVRSLLGGK